MPFLQPLGERLTVCHFVAILIGLPSRRKSMAKRKKQPKASELSRKHHYVSKRMQRQRRMLLAGGGAFLLLVLGIVGWGILNQTVLLKRKPVARVNQQVITAGEFQQRVRFQRAVDVMQIERMLDSLQAMMQNPMLAGYFAQQIQSLTQQLDAPEQLGQNVLDALIDEKLIVQKAKAMGITVTDAEVEKSLQESFGYYPDGTPTPTPTLPPIPTSTLSPTQLALLPPTATPTATPTAAASPTATPAASPTAVPPTPTPYTKEAFEKAYQQYLSRIQELAQVDERVLREIVRAQLYRQKLYEQVTKDTPRTREEVWARHILVKDEKTAQEVRQKLLAGGDWQKLAAEYSQDPGSKNKGGDVGWFGRGQMAAAFEKAAFSLKIGEISEPVKTRFGWHIIQVLGHEDRPLADYEYQQARQAAFKQWLKQAKAEADIEIFDTWKRFVPDKPTLSPQLQQEVKQFLDLFSQMQQPQLPPQPQPQQQP